MSSELSRECHVKIILSSDVKTRQWTCPTIIDVLVMRCHLVLLGIADCIVVAWSLIILLGFF